MNKNAQNYTPVPKFLRNEELALSAERPEISSQIIVVDSSGNSKTCIGFLLKKFGYSYHEFKSLFDTSEFVLKSFGCEIVFIDFSGPEIHPQPVCQFVQSVNRLGVKVYGICSPEEKTRLKILYQKCQLSGFVDRSSIVYDVLIALKTIKPRFVSGKDNIPARFFCSVMPTLSRHHREIMSGTLRTVTLCLSSSIIESDSESIQFFGNSLARLSKRFGFCHLHVYISYFLQNYRFDKLCFRNVLEEVMQIVAAAGAKWDQPQKSGSFDLCDLLE